jgi:outer membrane protein
MKGIAICASLAVAALAAASARAADSNWSIRAGPGFVITPEYPGGNDDVVLPIPMIDIAYGRSLFLSSWRGAGAYFVNNERWQLGASLLFRRGRDRRDAERVAALKDIDDHAAAQLFFSQNLGSIIVSTSVAQSITRNVGLTLDGSLAWQFRPSVATRAQIGVQGSFGSEKYMNSWFGITPQQARASGLREYSIDAGLRSAGAFASINYDFSPNWTIVAVAAYDALAADAADSPVVAREAMPMLAVGALYYFGRAQR